MTVPQRLTIVKSNGDQLLIDVDDDGYLLHLDDWSHDVAQALAQQQGVTLMSPHWEVLEIVQMFYNDYDLSPANRALVKAVKQRLGEDKGRSIYLMKLFGSSPAKTAALIAGVPRPANCF